MSPKRTRPPGPPSATSPRAGSFAGVDLDVSSTRAALKGLRGPVLLYGGELDPMVTSAALCETAPLFNDVRVVVQPEAAHVPWVDDPRAFAATVGSFLD